MHVARAQTGQLGTTSVYDFAPLAADVQALRSAADHVRDELSAVTRERDVEKARVSDLLAHLEAQQKANGDLFSRI